MSLIRCKDLKLAYEKTAVLEGIDFSVETGDYLCVVGENGSGKSTLMKAILGLITPAGGTIEFGDGLERNEIGYLPQQTIVQKDFPATVQEVVISGCLNKRGLHPFYSSDDKGAAKKNMELLKIYDLSKECYRDLSGGQQQRVLLARALCATSKMLLLDEPVTGLDPLVTKEMYALIKELNEEEGITVMMISHDVGSATEYANRILHLHNRQMFFGNTEDYVKSNIGRKFLGDDITDKIPRGDYYG